MNTVPSRRNYRPAPRYEPPPPPPPAPPALTPVAYGGMPVAGDFADPGDGRCVGVVVEIWAETKAARQVDAFRPRRSR